MKNEYEEILRFFIAMSEFYYIDKKVFLFSYRLVFFFGAIFGMAFTALLTLIFNS